MSRLHLYFPILIAAAGISAAASKPDFSGNWELQVDKSDFGHQTKPVRATIKSTRKGEVMHSSQTIYTAQDPQTTTYDWFLDGKRHPTDKPAPGYSVTRWEDDVLVNERRSDDGAYQEKVRMTLSRDGNTATEEIETKSPNGNNHEKLVWKKQAGDGDSNNRNQ